MPSTMPHSELRASMCLWRMSARRAAIVANDNLGLGRLWAEHDISRLSLPLFVGDLFPLSHLHRRVTVLLKLQTAMPPSAWNIRLGQACLLECLK